MQRTADALTARAKGHKARAERMRDRLERTLSVGETFRDARVVVKWRKSTAVDVYDPSLLPDKFMVQPPAPPARPDKAALRTALKTGQIDGAWLEHREKLVVD